jgi:hypothetical protein
MSKIMTDPKEAQAEMEKIQELRRVGGDAAVAEYFLQKAKEEDSDKKQKGRRENINFTQIYEAGWHRLQALIKLEPQAARLYAFFAENMGPDGTLCASRPTIAEALDIGTRTVSRHVKTLEDLEAIVVLKLGTANVYCLDPKEVWKSFDNAKPYAAFNTRTLVGKKENPYVKRRLATLLKGEVPKQKDWIEEDDDSVETHIGIAAE